MVVSGDHLPEGDSMSIDQAGSVTPAERARLVWDAQTAEADQVQGASLIGGRENTETLDKLVGVPFLITNVTFRQGDIKVQKTGQLRDYVSVEATVHPDFRLRFKRDSIVFNDGSTGIYRQIVAYLAGKGTITVPQDLPEEGGSNETRYDVSVSNGTEGSASYDIRLVCPEGLRKSDYTNDYGDAQTWYLA